MRSGGIKIGNGSVRGRRHARADDGLRPGGGPDEPMVRQPHDEPATALK